MVSIATKSHVQVGFISLEYMSELLGHRRDFFRIKLERVEEPRHVVSHHLPHRLALDLLWNLALVIVVNKSALGKVTNLFDRHAGLHNLSISGEHLPRGVNFDILNISAILKINS
jgi:hypothetical protein